MIELLSPAGSMEALQAAINGGADAVYLGGSRFNARAFAQNFDITQLKEAVKLCHLHGVRLFVTVNTVYKEEEIIDLFNYLKDLYEMQVDALIVQDEGLMHLIKDHFKDFEVHASTQCSVHNVDGIKHYQKLGIKRVVVARENSLTEIKEMIQNTNMEIETFVHGALCIAYSGQCNMSLMNGGRSANRGQCAQPCRLPYELLQDGQTICDPTNLLSSKDLCTIDHLDELVEAGIASLKIEGRMKRPAYVYTITNAYRQALDHVSKRDATPTLKQLFNRDFTDGHLFSENMITSPEYAGNRGVILGKVVGYDKKKKQLMIESMIDVHQQDGIRIGYTEEGKVLNKIYLNGMLTNKVAASQTFSIDYAAPVKRGTLIYRTTSAVLEKEIDQRIHQLYRKINISVVLKGKVGKPLSIEISDGKHRVKINSLEILTEAQKKPDLERIRKQLAKLGQTIYQAQDIQIYGLEDCFIPIKMVNDLRREACEQLDDLRQNIRVRTQDIVLPLEKRKRLSKTMAKVYLHFHDVSQLAASLPLKKDEEAFFDFTSEFAQAKELCPAIGLVLPTIMDESAFKQVDDVLKKYPDLKIAVNNVGAYERYQQNVTLLLNGMNLSHERSLACYDKAAVASLDLNEHDLRQLKEKADFAYFAYGRLDNMVTKHCPISSTLYGKKVPNCHACKKNTFALKDRTGAIYPLLPDNNCIVHILSEKPLRLSSDGAKYVRFTIESSNHCQEILSKIRKEA